MRKGLKTIRLNFLVFFCFCFSSIAHADFFVEASREGLDPNSNGCPCTTFGGHPVIFNDYFVALPSPSVISFGDSWLNRVRVSFDNNGTIRSIIAPVWDRGPMNFFDDYWNDDSVRTVYQTMRSYWAAPHLGPACFPTPPFDTTPFNSFNATPPTGNLGKGIPEAQVAFETSANLTLQSYNWGCNDSSGRTRYCIKSVDGMSPLTRAAIDIADGAFFSGLKLVGNTKVSWDFTTELPAVVRLQVIQNAVTIYDKSAGQPPNPNNPISTGQISIIVYCNQTMNTDPGKMFVTFGPMGMFNANTAVFVRWADPGYESDVWIGTATIPDSLGGQQIPFSVHAELWGQTEDGIPNQIDANEGQTGVYQPGVDVLNVVQVATPVLTDTPAIA